MPSEVYWERERWRIGAPVPRTPAATGQRAVTAGFLGSAQKGPSMAQRRPPSRSEDYAFEDEQGEHWGARLLREVLEVAVLTMLLFVAVRLFIQNYRVDGPSMQPTLHTNEYILVDRAEYYLHPPQRGDIIVFLAPIPPQQDFVKRVIGIPGDTIQVTPNGLVTVDGVTLNEPYVNDHVAGWVGSCRLGANQYFVMGDNRGESEDSRAFGPISRQSIIGKAALVYWPLSELHPLQTYSNVFARIHGPTPVVAGACPPNGG